MKKGMLHLFPENSKFSTKLLLMLVIHAPESTDPHPRIFALSRNWRNQRIQRGDGIEKYKGEDIYIPNLFSNLTSSNSKA